MPIRSSNATWSGSLHDGEGDIELGSGVYEGPYTFASRFEDGDKTNPEELIGAAHAGCFSMALSLILGENGYTPELIETTADVHLDADDLEIRKIELNTESEVLGIGEEEFMNYAEEAKSECPVSKALKGPQIELNATLV